MGRLAVFISGLQLLRMPLKKSALMKQLRYKAVEQESLWWSPCAAWRSSKVRSPRRCGSSP
jgi:hypothetical protein